MGGAGRVRLVHYSVDDFFTHVRVHVLVIRRMVTCAAVLAVGAVPAAVPLGARAAVVALAVLALVTRVPPFARLVTDRAKR